MSVASEIQRIQAAKQGIKQSAINLGFDIPSSALISSYPQNIQKTPLTLTMSARTDGDIIIIDLRVNPIPTNFWTGGTSGEYGTGNDNVFNISIDGVMWTCNQTDGQGQLVIPDLAGGEHVIEAVFVSSNYYSNYVTTSVTISHIQNDISISTDDITYGDNLIVKCTTAENATGTITVTIAGRNYTSDVSGGNAILIIPGLNAGSHNIDALYSGDDKYAPSTANTDVEVFKAIVDPSKIKVEGVNASGSCMVYGLPLDLSGKTYIYCEGETYSANTQNGCAIIDMRGQTTPGVTDVDIGYSGDENHTSAETTGVIITPKLDSLLGISVDDTKVGDTVVIIVNIATYAIGNITIYVTGSSGGRFVRPIRSGGATFALSAFTKEEMCYVCAVYDGDDNYNSDTATAQFTVSKITPDIIAPEVTKVQSGSERLYIYGPSDSTGELSIQIHDTIYSRTFVSGTASIALNLNPGVYPVTINYLGDNKYYSATTTTTVTVLAS